jgi:hypothetical protein
MDREILAMIDHAVLGTGLGVMGGLLLRKYLPRGMKRKLNRDELRSAEDLANRQRNFSETMFDRLED